MSTIPCFLNWSGGKDATFALYTLQKEQQYQVISLLTTINEQYQRISMHGVRRDLLEQQAEAVGIPLEILSLPEVTNMPVYNELMEGKVKTYQEKGIDTAVFGDIFLEDLKKYREDQLHQVNVTALFPLWKKPTDVLANRFIQAGFKAILVCVDGSKLDSSFAGRAYDSELLAQLPGHVDPCGENGEFHTFVYDGPNFHIPVAFQKGDVVKKSYHTKESSWDFWFCDLLPME